MLERDTNSERIVDAEHRPHLKRLSVESANGVDSSAALSEVFQGVQKDEDEGILLRYRKKELVGITVLEASKHKKPNKKL